MATKGRTKKFPEIKASRQGAFTRWAKNNGFSDACSAASAVMKNTKKYSSKVVKMADTHPCLGCDIRLSCRFESYPYCREKDDRSKLKK